MEMDNLDHLTEGKKPPVGKRELRDFARFLLDHAIFRFYLSSLENLAARFEAMGRRTRTSSNQPPELRDRWFGVADGLRTLNRILQRDAMIENGPDREHRTDTRTDAGVVE
jgi:hypothetical protein